MAHLIVHDQKSAAPVYDVDTHRNLVKFALNGLWFNISEAVPHTSECQDIVHRQLDWYLNADDVAQRRAALQIQQSAELHSQIVVRIVTAQLLWNELQNSH